ncbi:glycosyltransferase family 2 protein [Methylocaldum sp. BRCS4]|uniref:glycosyltransferase family 2 protein n=1 Tax=Methylocaldum sp. GT1TLB TaxID=3438965 RepID=UPI0012EB9694|nr:glycosyltransferase [Methylocaldum sp. BRCS4]
MLALPKVSIIIPVYNGSDYVSEAIDSALAQTYPNIEVLVINDGSNDQGKTENILKSYGSRLRYISKSNGGCASALNEGIRQMTGQYFSWLSHDDVYYPDKIARQMEYLGKCQSKDIILYGGYELINESSCLIGLVRPDSLYSIEKLNIPLFPVVRGLIHGCSLLVPRHCFDTTGLFDENLKTTQDYALWFKMFRNYQVHFLPDILIKSRIHPGQGTHTISGHLEECNQLWISFLDSVSLDEMCTMEGTPYLFYIRTAEFLKDTPYLTAQEYARWLAKNELQKKKISVVIPFYNRIEWTLEAINSVFKQTHTNFEVIIIDDGSTESVDRIVELCQSDSRAHYKLQNNNGPAAARNLGIQLATGDYIAFLDSDDTFHPEKLERQLELMELNRSKFSHTSYERMFADGRSGEVVNSGRLTGGVFPQLISCCPIATPTVILSKDAIKGKCFNEGFAYGEDVCLWIEISESYEVLGIDECLTRVRIGDSTAALNIDKQKIGIINQLFFLINHPRFGRFHDEISQLIFALGSFYGIPGRLSNTSEPSQVSRRNFKSRISQFISKNNLYSRIYRNARRVVRSLGRDGLNVTLRKIYRGLFSGAI